MPMPKIIHYKNYINIENGNFREDLTKIIIEI